LKRTLYRLLHAILDSFQLFLTGNTVEEQRQEFKK
jgi:hypothetical protein